MQGEKYCKLITMIKIEMQTGNDEASNNLGEEGKDGEEARRVIMLNLFTSLWDRFYCASL